MASQRTGGEMFVLDELDFDPVEAQVERLAKLITASPDPVRTAARAVQLLRDQLAQPPLGPTGRP